jgi:putative transposase
MISLKPGNIVKFEDKEYIIEKILESGSQLMLKSPNNEIKIVPLSELIKEKEPETQKTFSSLDNIRDELLKEAQRRFEIIKPLLDDETRTKKAVKQRAEETRIHTATIYRWIKEYKENGENLLALLPKRNNQGGRGRSRLNPQIEAIINFYIEKEYLNKQKISAKHLLLLINNELKKQNLPVISYATLLRRINEIDERFKYKKREGRTKFLNNLKPSGNSYEPQYPLEVIQIDHTPLDIQIVDETYRKPIGRPYITLAIDVATRMIYGFYLSLDAPSFYSVGQTIFMGISPKEPYLSSLNIEGIWPIQGLPTTIHTDNAAEFRGSNLEKFCSIFNINLMFRPKGQPFYGGHVERAIRTLNTYIHRLPGSTFSNPEERGEYNSEKKAVFTLKELEKYITEWIVNIYHKSPHKGIGGKTPLQIFEEKISSPDFPGIRLLTPQELKLAKISLLPGEYRTIQKTGVSLFNITYYDDILIPFIKPTAPNKKKETYLFRYDPKDLSRIYFYHPELEEYFEIPYRNLSHPAISKWELEAAKKQLKEQNRKYYDENDIFATIEKLRKMEEEAANKTKLYRRRKETKKTKPLSHKKIIKKIPEDINEIQIEEIPKTEKPKPKIKKFKVDFD